MIADVILIIHFTFITYVIGCQLLFMAGYHLKWRWVGNGIVRGIHILAVFFVVVQTWAEKWCPLTLLENKYRAAAGGDVYAVSFIQYWIGRLIYYDAPQWAFTLVHTLFGLLVAVYWMLIERRAARQRAGNKAPCR